MRACKQCGLSIGETATFCPVCGAIADPMDAALDPATEAATKAAAPAAPAHDEAPAAVTPADLESEARRCEKADAARAAALYRRAIVERLDASDDPLGSKAAQRDVQRLFDRLSLVLKRDGRIDEALEEIDAAAYLGLLDNGGTGTKAQREALVKRRDALRRAAATS
jgi:hypothetical protein